MTDRAGENSVVEGVGVAVEEVLHRTGEGRDASTVHSHPYPTTLHGVVGAPRFKHTECSSTSLPNQSVPIILMGHLIPLLH